jgi:hypothetical protein
MMREKRFSAGIRSADFVVAHRHNVHSHAILNGNMGTVNVGM